MQPSTPCFPSRRSVSCCVYYSSSFEFGRRLLILRKFRRRKTRTRVSLYTCIAVFLMFSMALAIWMLDIYKFIVKVKMTLLLTSDNSLSDDYAAALSFISRLTSVGTSLYSYMVRFLALSAMHVS